jgi:hypothetical protein
MPSRCPIFDNGRVERFWLHAELAVGLDPTERLVPETQQNDGLVDRRMRVVRTVDAKTRHVGPSGQPLRSHIRHRHFARGSKSMERRD